MKKFTSFLIIGLLTFLPLLELAQAQETENAFSTCEEGDDNSLKFFNQAMNVDLEKELDNNEFDVIFEEAQKAYHDYMSCLFGIAFEHVLKQEGKFTKGEVSAQVTSVNWLLPGQACISESDLIGSIEGTSPKVLMPKALKALEQYTAFLNDMNDLLEDKVVLGNISEELAQRSRTKTGELRVIVEEGRSRINNELQSSLMALEIAFNSLKELRFSFVAHVRFQCILRELGSYQKELRKIRRNIEALPNALKNASVNP